MRLLQQELLTPNLPVRILALLFQSFLSTEHASPRLSISTTGSLLYYVTSYLKNNVYHKDALATLSVDTGYSYSYLSHLFSEKIGQNFLSYLSSIRLSYACRLLAETDISVTDIAEDVGFESQSTFFRTFKNHYGITPLKYRQTAQQGKLSLFP